MNGDMVLTVAGGMCLFSVCLLLGVCFLIYGCQRDRVEPSKDTDIERRPTEKELLKNVVTTTQDEIGAESLGSCQQIFQEES